MVKTGAIYLQGEVFAFAVFVAKIKGGVVVLIGEGDAVFKLEGFVFYDVQHACFFQHVHAKRQQAFADHVAREMLLFYHADAEPLLPEQQGGNRACRACADDDDIVLFGHDFIPFFGDFWMGKF